MGPKIQLIDSVPESKRAWDVRKNKAGLKVNGTRLDS